MNQVQNQSPENTRQTYKKRVFAYGFGSRFLTRALQQLYLIQYLGLIVTVLGFGLILCFYAKGSILGLVTAGIAYAVNVQFSPLFQQFWYNVFIGQFNQTVPNDTTQTTLMQSQQLNQVQMNMMIVNITIAMTISYLVSSLATIGRLGIFQIIVSLVVYNIMWPIPYFCNIKLAYQKTSTPEIWDDLGTNYIFAFAAVFGITYSIFLSCKSGDKGLLYAITSKTASTLSLLGTCFAFVSLPWLGYQFSIFVPDQNYKMNLSAFNIYFSMIGSIVCTQAFGLVFGRKKLSIQGAIVGMISGASISGTVAGLDQTFSGFFIAGSFAGIICAFWIQIIHPKINKSITYDSLGLLGAVFFSSLFGSLAMAPIYQRIYYDHGVIPNTRTIRCQIAYYFITIVTAFVAGLIAGVIGLISRQKYNDYKFQKVFDTDFGLYNKAQPKNQQEPQSAQNLYKQKL